MGAGLATGQPIGSFAIDDSLNACEREMIRVPGAIQPHGILLAFTGPDHLITAVSANVAVHLNSDPTALLGKPVSDLVDAASLLLLKEAAGRPEANGPVWIRLRLNGSAEKTWSAAVHVTATGALLEAMVPRARPMIEPTELFDRYDAATTRLRHAPDATSVCHQLAAEVRNLIDFDRVAVYRFNRDWSGEVVAESSNGKLPPFLGLLFPAGDIPSQARELYCRNMERLVPDVTYQPVPLIQASPEPVDMTPLAIRSFSPSHTQYLKNMGIGASMSISILADDQLWGLVVCHHAQTLHVPPEIRQACVLLAQLVSWQLAVLQEETALRLGAGAKAVEAALFRDARSGLDYRESLHRHSGALLGLVNASGLALGIGGSLTTLGTTPPESALRTLLTWLAQRCPDVFETDNLAAVYPDAAALLDVGGLLAVPLGGGQDNIMVWFRPKVARKVTWAGDPSKAPPGGNGKIMPRPSFAAWPETIGNRCVPWQHHEVAAAQSLRDAEADIILRRSSELEGLNAQLVRTNEDLEDFVYGASHDLKEPLRQIETFGSLLEKIFHASAISDANSKQWFEGIQASSQRLRILIDDLAEYSRLGRDAKPFAPFDLNVILQEVLSDLGIMIDQTGANIVAEPLPVVVCDPSQIRQLLQNIISNSLKYRHPDRPPDISITTTTTPPGQMDGETVRAPMLALSVADNGMGFENKYSKRIFEPFQRLHSHDDYEGSGIGLAICSKIVERHGGTITATGTPGRGSVFTVTLPSRPLPDAG